MFLRSEPKLLEGRSRVLFVLGSKHLTGSDVSLQSVCGEVPKVSTQQGRGN